MGVIKYNGIDYTSAGGGEGDGIISITYEDYMALPEEEKNKGAYAVSGYPTGLSIGEVNDKVNALTEELKQTTIEPKEGVELSTIDDKLNYIIEHGGGSSSNIPLKFSVEPSGRNTFVLMGNILLNPGKIQFKLYKLESTYPTAGGVMFGTVRELKNLGIKKITWTLQYSNSSVSPRALWLYQPVIIGYGTSQASDASISNGTSLTKEYILDELNDDYYLYIYCSDWSGATKDIWDITIVYE